MQFADVNSFACGAVLSLVCKWTPVVPGN